MKITVGDVLIRRVELADRLRSPSEGPEGPPRSDRSDRSDRSAAGHSILRELVAELADVDPSEVFVYARCPDCGGDHGRPVVMAPDAARRIRVSLAYAGDTVIAAARPERSVGVDAERRNGPAVSDRRQAVRELAGSSADAADPLLHWTRIEAVLKADGRGLRVDPASVDFEQQGTRMSATVAGEARRYDVLAVPLGDDLFVSVAIETSAARAASAVASHRATP